MGAREVASRGTGVEEVVVGRDMRGMEGMIGGGMTGIEMIGGEIEVVIGTTDEGDAFQWRAIIINYISRSRNHHRTLASGPNLILRLPNPMKLSPSMRTLDIISTHYKETDLFINSSACVILFLNDLSKSPSISPRWYSLAPSVHSSYSPNPDHTSSFWSGAEPIRHRRPHD